MLKAGVITDQTQAWSSGLAEWKALKEILGATSPPAVSPPQMATAATVGSPPRHFTPTDAPPAPASFREIASPTRRNKWIVVLTLVFCILSIIAVAIYVFGHPNTNRNTVATGGQGGPLAANVVVASVQSASGLSGQKSGQIPTTDSNSQLPEERLGDLFPSISQYGNPQYVINWKNIDPTVEYDKPFEFVDYPARTGFIVPPTDIAVLIYPPAIGPVVESASPLHRVRSPCDCIVYYTDTRPGACVVWVSRTNTDSASVSLCADFAVFTACAIAGEHKYMKICEGGGWRRSPSAGGALVYMPVLFYKDKPSTDANIQIVQEVRSRVTKTTDTLLYFLNAAATEEAQHSKSNSVSH